jgi:ribosomal protein S3AE
MAVKKKFINVEIPIINESMPVLGDAENLVGRTIKLDLSRKLKGRGLEVVFQIMNKDGKLVAHPKNLTLMRSYVQRMMRKRVNYVEDSFIGSCKDITITIKPFLITRKKVSRAIRNNLRKTAKEFVLEYVKTKTYMELAEEIIFGEMQKQMYPRLKKVYPLSLCEIRILETKELAKADLTVKIQETPKEEAVELTQAEEIEAEQKKKAEEAKEKSEEIKEEKTEDKKEKKSKKKPEEKE